MKTVPLHGAKAAGRVALVDDEDYDLAMRHRWYVQERARPNGAIDGPYAATKLPRSSDKPRALLLHRLLMPGVRQVDHIDGDGLNCQRANLRDASQAQNQANARKSRTYGGKPTSSRFKGVYWDKTKTKWCAAILVDGRTRHLGRFANEVEAARAYDKAAAMTWGEFARLNFPVTPDAAPEPLTLFDLDPTEPAA